MSCVVLHHPSKPSYHGLQCELLKHFHMPLPFSGIKSKTMKYTNGKTSKSLYMVHGPLYSSNEDFTKHHLYKQWSQILFSFIMHVFSAVVLRNLKYNMGLWFPSEIIWLVCFLKVNMPYGTSPRPSLDQTEK